MSSLSLRAPLFTSICGEIGNWNWPCHCLPWPLIWVSFTFSHTPLVFLSEHSWLQQRLMSPDMWVKHRDRGWMLKRQHPSPPLPAVHVSPTSGHAGGKGLKWLWSQMQSMDPRSCISLRVLFEAKRVFFTPRTELIVTERRKTGRKMMKNKESEVDRVTIRGSSLQRIWWKKKKNLLPVVRNVFFFLFLQTNIGTSLCWMTHVQSLTLAGCFFTLIAESARWKISSLIV